MRLRKIKLSGFKSFVDPTTLIVPGNLVGVVGPNGCGKSNISDAVMWVMGESSAKHLRGDSLTDVIFNGSTTRQPVGQASVELVFDNSEHKLGGQYASYTEIALRRQMDREGISSYFLNGTRCRRKDIQSIFLGTGLGPRSYAIIEQGTISRLIEAKPDELRGFIEEAAGISKYRERRRETENRIHHTRDNLARVNDIRDELAKQLDHLHRQARAAERYQSLKQEERRFKAELLALNWKDLKAQAQARGSVVREQENRVEEGLAALRAAEAQIERQRGQFTTANEAYSTSQAAFYEIDSHLSQLEQKIQHGEERIRALDGELGKTGVAHAAAQQQLRHDEGRLGELGVDAGSLEPALRGSRNDSHQAYEALNLAEQAVQGWQTEWDACNEAAAAFVRQLDVDSTREGHIQEGLLETGRRRKDLDGELKVMDSAKLQREVEHLAAECKQLAASLVVARGGADRHQEELRRCRSAADEAGEKLSTLRLRHQELAGEGASLKTLRAAGEPDKHVAGWMQKAGVDPAKQLLREVQIEAEWAQAMETVLGARLDDYCAADLDAAVATLQYLDHGTIGLVGPAQKRSPVSGAQWPRLQDKVKSRWQLGALLDGVFVADDLKSALRIHADLKIGESVVTRDGVWLGCGWARVHRPASVQDGVLARERRMEAVGDELQAVAREIKECEDQLSEQRERESRIEVELAAAQRAAGEAQDRLAGTQARHAEARTRLEESERREQQIREELESLDVQEEEDRRDLVMIRERLQRTESDERKFGKQREELVRLRDKHREALDAARSQWQSTHEHSHEIALRLESISSQRASLDQAIQRTRMQISGLDARMQEVESGIADSRAPLAELRSSLDARLADKSRSERELAAARESVQSLDHAVRESERDRSGCEQRIEELRASLESARLAAQEVLVRVQTLEEQLQASGQKAEQLLGGMPEDATVPAWQEQLESAERRIQRLGPINLAAIEEFRQLAERKEYLDRQHADLNEALTTLEDAIRKIDKESRTRFKETFDRLNGNLKEMFPILFGGGHAYLETTGEDLLETGVTIMARPPGKRNSTIHLLSGGEKALTAVALVFAIFKLNPAPFCILDEVDAPLDDTNVGRFSNLLSEMSREVQFIFITHNKITMEIAQQLLGVTMHEAGVSRLVSVDVEEAVQLAATA
ncbi:MAG: chromosome segregation protein SMC [Gammaproteobacteria bacterium]|nr:chromosome segregation protein SMC [Gammaproteobacteria bacterium]